MRAKHSKPNKLALRVLSTAAVMAMVSSIAAPAFADAYGIAVYGNYYLDQGSITVTAKEGGVHHVTVVNEAGETVVDKDDKDGWVAVMGHEDKNDKSAVSNTVTVNAEDKSTANVTIKDATIETKGAKIDPTQPSGPNEDLNNYKNGITVKTNGENATANITLDNVTVDTRREKDPDFDDPYGGAGMAVTGNGTTSIELNGKNTLTGGVEHAGLEKVNSDRDSKGKNEGHLIIKDDYDDKGNLKSDEQKKAEWATGEGAGSLTANGGVGGAGIGSIVGESTSNIKITGGSITAVGASDGAGIGGGEFGDAENIEITGGNITAVGNGSGAGIGSGAEGTASIIISGGKIEAIGGSVSGAGIGGGESGEDTTVKITGGNVIAKSDGGAGIGGGSESTGNLKITISGKDTCVTANSKNCAGIGTGDYASNDKVNITIDGGTVNATGSTGIGIADDSQKFYDDDPAADNIITINGGKITAIGDGFGAGIGNGTDSVRKGTTTITITGGEITAKGGKKSAGIGDGGSNYGNTVNVAITGGNIEAVGSEGASAIGGGCYEGDSDPIITVKIDGSNRALKVTAMVKGDGKGAIGEGVQEDEDPFTGVDFDTITADKLGEDHGALVQFYNNYDETTGTGTLYKAIHNQKYIAENYADHVNDDHAWSNPTVIKAATPEEDGMIRYACAVEGCPETLDVPYKYVAPAEADDAQTMEVGVIFWDAANNAAAPDYLQGKTLNVENTASAVSKAQADSVLADKEHWALAEDAGDLEIHPAADAAGTVYEQAVNASGCDYYVIANVTAQ